MNFIERMAEVSQLKYVKLPGGNIGVVCNGGGHGLASNDLIEFHGGKPANFVDLSGDAYFEKIRGCFIILQKDEEVDSVYINMFFGHSSAINFVAILLNLLKDKRCTKPMVCRFKGLDAKEAYEMIGNA